MFHYSTYVNLQRAIDKIQNADDGAFRFPDEVHLRLYAAAELGFKAVEQFGRIYEVCLKEKPDANSQPLRQLVNTFGKYRNLIHEQVPAVGSDACANVTMPRREKIEEYRKWTTVLYYARPEDFVSIRVQVNDDLRTLCSALEDAWKQMCRLSLRLVSNSEYLRRRGSGETEGATRGERILTSSNTAVYSASAVGTILIRDFSMNIE
jgi:hypothetical protein